MNLPCPGLTLAGWDATSHEKHLCETNVQRHELLIMIVSFRKNSVYLMKAKAEAEAKQLQAQGLKRGEDFLDCKPLSSFQRNVVFPHCGRALLANPPRLAAELEGNKQADDVKSGIGSLGGLKKSL